MVEENYQNKSDDKEDPTNDQEEESESDTTDTKEEDLTADDTNQEIRNAPVPLEASVAAAPGAGASRS